MQYHEVFNGSSSGGHGGHGSSSSSSTTQPAAGVQTQSLSGVVPKRNFYAVLGINREASAETVKKAYQKLAFKFHPDRNHGNAVLGLRTCITLPWVRPYAR